MSASMPAANTAVKFDRVPLSTRGAIRAASWPVAMLVMVSHIAWGDPGYPTETLACAGLLAAVAVVACAYVRPGVLPIIPIVLLRFYIAMGFPVFNPPYIFTAIAGRVRISSRAMIEAGAGGLLFATCMITLAVLTIPLARRLRDPISYRLDPRRYDGVDTVCIRCLAVISLSINLLLSFYEDRATSLPATFSAAARFVGSSEFSLGLLFWDAYKTRSRASRIGCWAATGLLSLAGLSTGMLGAAMWPGIVATLFLWTVEARVPLRLILSLAAAVIILNPAKLVYRELSWHADRELSLIERAENWNAAVSKIWSSGNVGTTSNDAATGVASRMSSLLQVVHMFEWVPTRVPHAGPEAWIMIPLWYIPRILWPEKPSQAEEFNTRYALTFRIYDYRMSRRSAATLPSIGDGYWRLGWLGVAIEGAILGIVAGFCHGVTSRTSRALTIIGLGYCVSGGGPEGGSVGLLVTLPRYFGFLVLLLLVAQWLPQIIRAGKTPGKTEAGGGSSSVRLGRP